MLSVLPRNGAAHNLNVVLKKKKKKKVNVRNLLNSRLESWLKKSRLFKSIKHHIGKLRYNASERALREVGEGKVARNVSIILSKEMGGKDHRFSHINWCIFQ